MVFHLRHAPPSPRPSQGAQHPDPETLYVDQRALRVDRSGQLAGMSEGAQSCYKHGCSPVVGVVISSVGVPFLQGDSAGEGKSQQHTHHGVWEGEWSVECGGGSVMWNVV